MKRAYTLSFAVLLILSAIGAAHAQEIWGLSTLSFKDVDPIQPLGDGSQGIIKCTRDCYRPVVRETQAYADTEEDYVASLYYDVTSSSAIYASGNPTPSATGTFTGNPSAATTFATNGSTAPAPILWSEVTDHIVDFFYLSSYGAYYDPYGFGVVTNPDDPSGDYDSGYWFSVVVYGAYISEASVLLGEDWDASTDTLGDNYQGPNIETLMYQAFIPPDWVTGPPAASCLNDIYAGDNRINPNGTPLFIPTLGSFRTMQSISVGVGGYTAVNQTNAPPAQATGWSYQFSNSVLQNNMIPATAYNYDYLGHCTPYGSMRSTKRPPTR